MMNIPTIPTEVYSIKTPRGHRAFYYEDISGEPFLLDDNDNLWIWVGADVNNPIDDWLVRTPEGDIYNYYMDSDGKLQDKRLGNERDLRMIPDTNLGTLMGFSNIEPSDYQYEKIPLKSIEKNYETKIGHDDNNSNSKEKIHIQKKTLSISSTLETDNKYLIDLLQSEVRISREQANKQKNLYQERQF